ncbi:hypothetical protein [Stigmatella erecta]|nr:hypothetical protein [Stigmatella erecta]
MLVSNSLTALFSSPGNGYIQTQLMDPNARKVMPYLVGCALPAGASLAWTHPSPEPGADPQGTWAGEAGLCPEWSTQAPSQACLERVSACVLARNNPFGRRVELSLRGQHASNPGAFSLGLQTRPLSHDPASSQPVASLVSCTSTQAGASRNCGWSVDYIGACSPGTQVRVGAGGPLSASCSGAALGSTGSGQAVLRVCGSIASCDDASKLSLSATCGPSVPPVGTFTCPASGYFNVMTALSVSSAQVSATVQVAPPASYRLSEKDVFPVREGAYYGNILDAKALAIEIRVQGGHPVAVDVNTHQVLGPASGASVSGSVYRKMYSCYDAKWLYGAAEATHRVCALPSSGSNCAAQVTGPCLEATQPTFPGSMCTTEDGPQVVGDGDYEGCRSSASELWLNPVTVFLHAPCDVVGPYRNASLCKRLP